MSTSTVYRVYNLLAWKLGVNSEDEVVENPLSFIDRKNTEQSLRSKWGEDRIS